MADFDNAPGQTDEDVYKALLKTRAPPPAYDANATGVPDLDAARAAEAAKPEQTTSGTDVYNQVASLSHALPVLGVPGIPLPDADQAKRAYHALGGDDQSPEYYEGIAKDPQSSPEVAKAAYEYAQKLRAGQPPAQANGAPTAPKTAEIDMGAAGGQDKDPIADFLAQHGAAGGGMGAGMHTSGDLGPVAMEHQDLSGIAGATEGKRQGLEHEADANKQIAKDSLPVYAQNAKDISDVTDQGQQHMAEDRARQGDFMTRAAAASDEAVKVADQMGPDHYWNSLSTPDKIWKTASMILSGGGAGVTHGPAYAIDRVKDEIARDTAAQMQQIKSREFHANNMNSLAAVAGRMFSDDGQAMAWLTNQKLQQASALFRHIGAKYADPKIQAQYEQAANQLSLEGVTQMNQAREKENVGRLQGAQAREANARAAREGFNMRLDAARYGLESSKLEASLRQGMVIDPETKQVLTDPSGRPIMREPADASKYQQQMIQYSNQLRALALAKDQAGKLYDYDTARHMVVAQFPPEQQKQVDDAMAGVLSRGGTVTDAIDLIKAQIQNQRGALITGLTGSGGNPAQDGATRHD